MNKIMIMTMAGAMLATTAASAEQAFDAAKIGAFLQAIDEPAPAEHRWQYVPKQEQQGIVRDCRKEGQKATYGDNNYPSNTTPDFKVQADCISRQLQGWFELQKMLPATEGK